VYAPAYFRTATVDDGRQGKKKGRRHHGHHHGHHRGWGALAVLAKLKAIEARLNAMDAKRDVEKLVEARIKEERVRNELKNLRERVEALELDRKLKGLEQQGKQRLDSLEKKVGELEKLLKKILERRGDDGKPQRKRGSDQDVQEQSSDDEETVEETDEQSTTDEQVSVPAQRSRIIVSLPDGAKLYVAKKRIRGSSFLTPPLASGTYSYELRVHWLEDGQWRRHTRTVSFQPGTQTYVNFDDLVTSTE
jgi:uncharacterized protein (TIGR03000 family)